MLLLGFLVYILWHVDYLRSLFSTSDILGRRTMTVFEFTRSKWYLQLNQLACDELNLRRSYNGCFSLCVEEWSLMFPLVGIRLIKICLGTLHPFKLNLLKLDFGGDGFMSKLIKSFIHKDWPYLEVQVSQRRHQKKVFSGIWVLLWPSN